MSDNQKPPLEFSGLVTFLEKYQSAKNDNARRRKLRANVLQAFRLRKDESEVTVLFRLLLPREDRTRVYGLKEQQLARLIPAALSLQPDSREAQLLKSYKLPSADNRSVGDFAQVAFDVIAPRSIVDPNVPCHVTLEEVDRKLDALAEAVDLKDREAILRWAISTLPPLQVKWFLRIILKDLKSGMAEKTLFEEWHPDAYQVWTTSSDFGAVARLLDPNERIRKGDMEIKVLSPFFPMLASPARRFNTLPEKLQDFAVPFWCQPKIDGERVVIHYKDGQFCFLSRNNYSWTTDFGADFQSGSWTKHVGRFFNEELTEFILDGEMVAADKNTKQVLPFGTLRSASRATGELDDLSCHPRYYCFDIVFVQGTSLQDHALSERYKVLGEFFREVPDWFEILHPHECSDARGVLDCLMREYNERGEGVVVKDPRSPYHAGARSHQWLKVKIDYEHELMETLDLTVIGARWGEGKRKNKYSSFLCALRDPGKLPGGGDKFISFVRVGTGFSHFLLEELSELMQENVYEFDRSLQPPQWVELTGSAREAPDVIVRDPERALVIEVSAAEITPSNDWAVGATLRFPRALNWRRDRSPADAMTLHEIHALWQRTEGRLVKTPPEDMFESKRKRRSGMRLMRKRADNIHSTFMEAGPQEGAKQFFAGRVFIVRAEPAAISKNSTDDPRSAEYIQRAIQEHGGRIIANLNRHGGYVGQDTGTMEHLMVVADNERRDSVARMIVLGKYDVLKLDHILNCLNEKRWREPSPNEYLFMRKETRERLKLCFDDWGDSFTEPLQSNEELELQLKRMLEGTFQTYYFLEMPPDSDEQPHLVKAMGPQWRGDELFSMSYDGVDDDDILLSRYSADAQDIEEDLRKRRRTRYRQLEELRARYFNVHGFPLRWFSGMIVYPHIYQMPGNVFTRVKSFMAEMAVAQLVMYGAELTSDPQRRDLTHILLVDSEGLPITPKWVSDCCEEETRLPEPFH